MARIPERVWRALQTLRFDMKQAHGESHIVDAEELEVVLSWGEQEQLSGVDHTVELNNLERGHLLAFLAKPNGSLTLGNRLTVEAVEGGGVLVRTKPFRSTP